jgi:hypothetical protein
MPWTAHPVRAHRVLSAQRDPVPDRQSMLRRLLRPTSLLSFGLALVLLGVTFNFQRVVAQGVVQGAQRRSAEAARADGLLHCRPISRPEARRQCLANLPKA